MKECKNPECKVKWFILNKYAKGHQKVCGNPECKNYLNRERQRKHYEKHSKDPTWVEAQAKRKKSELERRKSEKTSISERIPQGESTSASEFLARILCGVISYVSGSVESETVREVLELCNQRGQDLLSSYGEDKNLLLEKLFLTSV